MRKTVIVSGARTPFGRFGGALASLSASQLGGKAIRAAIERGGIAEASIDEVIVGNVLQAGQGQIPSRQAAHVGGLPWTVKTETINKVCASGMRSVTLADQLIRLGEDEVIVAGGMESMSNAPYILPNARTGYRMGDQKVIDSMVHDGLTCSFADVHMGIYGNEMAVAYGIRREAQDAWALRSQKRAIQALEAGKFVDEIIPLPVINGNGESILISDDESPRMDTSKEGLSNLRPVFGKAGTITAGNAPGINDGACAFVLMGEEKAVTLNKTPLATILGHAEMAGQPSRFPETPGYAIKKLVAKVGLTVEDIDLFEINEAFAAVTLISMEVAGINPEKVNVNGGAVALGHPIGASGSRLILTLIHELKRRGGGLGIAAICSGGGQGDAILIEVAQ